jgi:hypothetical protein
MRPVGDACYGGAGNDLINAEDDADDPGRDVVYGGADSDEIFADDENLDIINCGDGQDTAHIDGGIDRVRNCENT